MYFPLDPKECFMKGSDNIFNVEIAKRQKDKLASEYPGFNIGMRVELDEGCIVTGKQIGRAHV